MQSKAHRKILFVNYSQKNKADTVPHDSNRVLITNRSSICLKYTKKFTSLTSGFCCVRERERERVKYNSHRYTKENI